jgi:hypothetical protein
MTFMPAPKNTVASFSAEFIDEKDARAEEHRARNAFEKLIFFIAGRKSLGFVESAGAFTT